MTRSCPLLRSVESNENGLSYVKSMLHQNPVPFRNRLELEMEVHVSNALRKCVIDEIVQRKDLQLVLV